MIKKIRRSSTIALLLSPVGVLIIAATRLLIISNYEMSSALAILASAGYVNTLLGSVFPLIPAFLPYLALILLYLNRVMVACLALVATVLISPATMSRSSAEGLLLHEWERIIGGGFWWHALLTVLAVPTAFLILWAFAGFGPGSIIRISGTIFIICMLPTVVRIYPAPLSEGFYTGIVRQPWLPAEAITLKSNQTVIVYKLDDGDGIWMEVLRADDRTVHYYPMSGIVGRQLCRQSDASSGRPMASLFTASPELKSCNSLLSQNRNENQGASSPARFGAGADRVRYLEVSRMRAAVGRFSSMSEA